MPENRPSSRTPYLRLACAAAFVFACVATVLACLPDDPAWDARFDYAPDPPVSEASLTDTNSPSDAAGDGGEGGEGGEGGDADPDAGDADPDASDADPDADDAGD